MGGEKARDRASVVMVKGSPPRGRGKVGRNVCRVVLNGITPAWAGKRVYAELQGRVLEDHPRVGGEKAGMAG